MGAHLHWGLHTPLEVSCVATWLLDACGLERLESIPIKLRLLGFCGKNHLHNSYAKLFPTAEGYEDMLARLEGESDFKSDLELWGGTKSKYTLADLGEWLKKQKGKKVVKPATKSAKGAKEKEKRQGSGSGSGSGIGEANQTEVKQKEVVPEEVDNKKKSHKKKVTASGWVDFGLA